MSAALAIATESNCSSIQPEIWLERYGDYLYRFAMFRLRDASLAEDVLQETLLAALQSHQKFAHLSTEKTWLVGILKHKIMDHFRRTSRESIYITHEDESGESEADFFDKAGAWREDRRPSQWSVDPAADLEQKELWEIFYSCLDKLPERTARIFILREVDGLTSDEICEQLNIKPNNLWVMLHRARLQLRLELEQYLASQKTERRAMHSTAKPNRVLGCRNSTSCG